MGALLGCVMLSACAGTKETQAEVLTTPVATSTPPTSAPPTINTSATTNAQPTSTTVPLGDPDDVATEIRAAVEASRSEQWIAWTIEVQSQEPITMIFENGVATGCWSLPANAVHSLTELFDALGSVDQATVQANDTLDPESPDRAMFFYDVQTDEQGRLAATSWYSGHLAMFTTFAYSPEQAPAIDCSTASTATTA